MPSAFPTILSYWMYAPLLLRAVAGAYFFSFGYIGLRAGYPHRVSIFESIRLRPAPLFVYTLCIVEMIGGMFLLMGFLVQITAIVFAVMTLTSITVKLREKDLIKKNVHTYILLFVIVLSLIILGAGYYGMDLPL